MEGKTDCRKWILCWYFLIKRLHMTESKTESQDTFSFLDIYILKHIPKFDRDKHVRLIRILYLDFYVLSQFSQFAINVI